MTSVDIQELNVDDTIDILGRLDQWRLGICPNGALATEPCFVLKQRPCITIHPDQSVSVPRQQYMTTELITERDWSNNLVDCGVINHLNDDILMKTLSDFNMIFHANDKVNNSNTLHSLQLQKHASFKVDNILRPTRLLSMKLAKLSTLTVLDEKWKLLDDIWDTFGYLWPRKIVLGYKTHMKQTYKFMDPVDSMNGYYHNLSKIKEQFNHNNEPFDLTTFLENATVIARVDIAPIHEFMNTTMAHMINDIIYSKFVQIPVYCPIKIYNISTHSYLCWDPYGRSLQDPSFDGENHDYLVRAVSAEPSELVKNLPESQYIWRFTWTPASAKNTSDTFDPSDHRSRTVRGCNKVYIYPACKSISPKGSKKSPTTKTTQGAWQINDRLADTENLMDTHKMVLSCRPYGYEAKSTQPEFSKLRALRLLSTESLEYKNEKIDWTIEYPDNGLKYMTDAQANIKLNFHEHVRRMKPLLSGDIIQLQQIGLLTAFPPVNKLSPSPQQQHHEVDPHSLKTTKKILTRKPSLKATTKRNVLCVDEDITQERWRENTFWRIELVTKEDMDRHSSNFTRWQQSNRDEILGYPKEYHALLSQSKFILYTRKGDKYSSP